MHEQEVHVIQGVYVYLQRRVPWTMEDTVPTLLIHVGCTER